MEAEQKKLKEEAGEQEKKTEDIVRERKQKIRNIFKNKKTIIFYILLVIIIFIGANIRVENLDGLKDVTTGNWTLGPDLDPFLFLRWAKYIAENGTLMKVDYMRNVPLGFNTGQEMKLLAYLIAWFYKVVKIFSSGVSVDYAAIIFPVVFFVLTAIAFFLFVKKLFEDDKHNYQIALASTALFAVLPSLLSRTIAGIPEKESVGFFFLFLAFYFFLCSWKAEKTSKNIAFGILAGVSTTLMALIWGGFVFIFLVISLSTFIAFLFGEIEKKQFISYSAWLFSSALLMISLSIRYTPISLITSTSTSPSFVVFFILVIDKLVYWKLKNNEIIKRLEKKLPRRIISLILAACLVLILAILIFGPGVITHQVRDVIEKLIHPFATDRFTLTVAENRQPYFDEWKNSFGPVVQGIPLFFWLFFIGSIALFYEAIKKLRKKERLILTLAYVIFLFCLVFSRYSTNSIMNGVSTQSKIVYLGGMIVLGVAFFYTYFKYFKENLIDLFKEVNFYYVFILVLFFLTAVAARGGVRLIMVLAPVATIIVGYLSIALLPKARNKDELLKVIATGLAILIIISSLYVFYVYYNTSKNEAKNFVPSQYTIQWQKAMAWVRQNTSEDAVFAHWWDYGYWLQSIGNRATVLDGGNAIVYWNYLMGRYVLTGIDKTSALEYLYAHNATYLLIDSTDIGKYPAYSSIGSDENYDRYSWIQTFSLDKQATKETKNETKYLYRGGFLLDGDFVWKQNGQEVFLPAGSAGIGGFIIGMENNQSDIKQQPEAIFVYQNKQINIPLRYVYYKNKLYDFKTGYGGGAFILSNIEQQTQGVQVDNIGAAIFLSERTINSFLARLYLFNETADGTFELVHNQPNWIIENLRSRGLNIEDFAFFGSELGPIKIWKINYPKDIKFNPDYLKTEYPSEKLKLARGF